MYDTSLPRRAPGRSNRGRNIAIVVVLVAVIAAAVIGVVLATHHSSGAGGSTAGASTPSATAVAQDLKAAGLPIGTVTTYTAATDPNHLLGRPNEYISKVAFTDTRINGAAAAGYVAGDPQLGGGVEVFADPSDAQTRATYIAGIIKAMPALTEYDYLIGDVLVRVSGQLTPTEAAAYQAAAQHALS